MTLREFLNRPGCTMRQGELADKCGIPRSTFNEIVMGRYQPSLEYACRIEDATDGAVSMRDWLVK